VGVWVKPSATTPAEPISDPFSPGQHPPRRHKIVAAIASPWFAPQVNDMKPLLAVTLGLACSVLPLNRASVAAGVSPAVEPGVPPGGFKNSWTQRATRNSLMLSMLGTAAEPPTNQQELERKEAEVLRLRDELKNQERELQRLRTENESLRKAKERLSQQPPVATPAAVVPTPTPAPPPAPIQPLQQIAPPAPTDTVDASDLAAYFATEPDLAAAKFLDRTFLIRGTASRLETPMLQRRFWVDFRSADPSLRVRALVVFPVGWQAVFAARDTSKLIERQELGNRTVLETGETILLRARCQGVRGNEIRFDRGELLPSPLP
jgi:hypothetical protein